MLIVFHHLTNRHFHRSSEVTVNKQSYALSRSWIWDRGVLKVYVDVFVLECTPGEAAVGVVLLF